MRKSKPRNSRNACNSITTSKMFCPHCKREREIYSGNGSFFSGCRSLCKNFATRRVHKQRWKDFTQYWPPTPICEVIIPWLMSFSSHFCFSFWPTKIQKYYIIIHLLFHYFWNFQLACLALQDAKTQHMEMKISKPFFYILVALTENELTKICNEPGI